MWSDLAWLADIHICISVGNSSQIRCTETTADAHKHYSLFLLLTPAELSFSSPLYGWSCKWSGSSWKLPEACSWAAPANADCTYFKSYIRRGKPREKISLSFSVIVANDGQNYASRLVEEFVGGEVYGGRNKEPWIFLCMYYFSMLGTSLSRDTKTDDPARLPSQVFGGWGLIKWKKRAVRKIIFCTGLIREAKAGAKSLVPERRAQQANHSSGLLSYVLKESPPQFNSQQGPPLLGSLWFYLLVVIIIGILYEKALKWYCTYDILVNLKVKLSITYYYYWNISGIYNVALRLGTCWHTSNNSISGKCPVNYNFS